MERKRREAHSDSPFSFGFLKALIYGPQEEEKQMSEQSQEGQESNPEHKENEESSRKKKMLFWGFTIAFAILAAVMFRLHPSLFGRLPYGNPPEPFKGEYGKKLKVVLLGSEWDSSKGGVSTFNRQLAIHLAKRSDLEVICYLPKVSDHDKKTALKYNVTLFEAEDIPDNRDPLLKLQQWPSQWPSPDVIISHGQKFGKAAFFIKDKYKSCKWVHFVHANYEEMAKLKNGDKEMKMNNQKDLDEISYCRNSDIVVAVGPNLLDRYNRGLSSEQKDVQVFYPGLSREFFNLTRKRYESMEFHIYTFCRCSSEDFELKGVDVLIDAVWKLGKKYKVHVVGVPENEEVNTFQHTLKKSAITKNQLYVREYCNNREELKRMLGEADLVVMPSRAEAFGLIGLEALSAGVPLLVSASSGLGMTLKELTFGETCVVESDNPQEWANRIESVKEKERSQRYEQMEQLRKQYDEKYKWEEQCSRLAQLFSDKLENN